MAFKMSLAFILSHFEVPIWPRKLSTRTTEGRQVLVYSQHEALARFRQARFLDCRINAYPSYTEWKGLNRQAPNFLFIDLDLSRFKSIESLNRALKKTLKFIKEKLGDDVFPTVLWISYLPPCSGPYSGTGKHIRRI